MVMAFFYLLYFLFYIIVVYMKLHFFICRILAIITIVISFSGCSNQWQPDPIEDVNDLKGRRVGVNLSWEADYILTPRKDMEIFRYDSTSDLLLALQYNKIDAIAVDLLMWNLLEDNSTGLLHIEPAFATTGYTYYISGGREDIKDEYNDFLKQFKTTETYRDFIERENSFDGYYDYDIPLTGTGKVLKVAMESASFPRSYLDPGETIPKGFDLEPLKHFANQYNYQLDFYPSYYDDIVLGLVNGLYDIGVGYLSEVYRSEVNGRNIFLADPFDEVPLYFVQKSEAVFEVDISAVED